MDAHRNKDLGALGWNWAALWQKEIQDWVFLFNSSLKFLGEVRKCNLDDSISALVILVPLYPKITILQYLSV